MVEINGNYYLNLDRKVQKTSSKKANQPSFTGHKVLENSKGEKVYRFYLPAANVQSARVQFVTIDRDKNGNFIFDPEYTYEKNINLEKGYLDLPMKKLGMSPDNPNKLVGYRFIITDKDGNERLYLDNVMKAVSEDGKEEFNVAINPDRPALNQARHM